MSPTCYAQLQLHLSIPVLTHVSDVTASFHRPRAPILEYRHDKTEKTIRDMVAIRCTDIETS